MAHDQTTGIWDSSSSSTCQRLLNINVLHGLLYAITVIVMPEGKENPGRLRVSVLRRS